MRSTKSGRTSGFFPVRTWTYGWQVFIRIPYTVKKRSKPPPHAHSRSQASLVIILHAFLQYNAQIIGSVIQPHPIGHRDQLSELISQTTLMLQRRVSTATVGYMVAARFTVTTFAHQPSPFCWPDVPPTRRSTGGYVGQSVSSTVADCSRP